MLQITFLSDFSKVLQRYLNLTFCDTNTIKINIF